MAIKQAIAPRFLASCRLPASTSPLPSPNHCRAPTSRIPASDAPKHPAPTSRPSQSQHQSRKNLPS
ncbi:hypothetical protein IG631_15506 [Alternaria alternata]|nr:hypothetical protein IG631_15506 [Alternaria alternata]